MTLLGWIAVLGSMVAAGLVMLVVAPPRRRLAQRVRPYAIGARTSLGRTADAPTWATGSPVQRMVWPLLEPVAARIATRLDPDTEAALATKLRQADFLSDRNPEQRVLEFRVRSIANALVGGLVGAFVAEVLGLGRGASFALLAVGLIGGWARYGGRLDRLIEERRTRIRIELYTINQLLAMHLRVGGGIVQALQRVVDRGNGVVVDELGAALAMHGTGRDLRACLLAAAEDTPEPTAARTYRLLAVGAAHGADLASSLLEHADDVRQARREAMERQATRRRAGMLLPIIAILAPVMLLFIAAPLPSIIFGVG